MAARFWILSGVLAAILVAGCGGASHKRAQLPTALRGVIGRTLVTGELSGFTPAALLASYGGAYRELPEDKRPQELARLKSLGFIGALRERLVAARGSRARGLSIVEQFRSPRGARAELANQVQRVKASGRVTAFAVPAIPGARGFGGPGPPNGRNVVFTKGSYYYLVGVGWPTGDRSAPTRATVIAAARRLYRRVRG
jgi:hypothetical protein